MAEALTAAEEARAEAARLREEAEAAAATRRRPRASAPSHRLPVRRGFAVAAAAASRGPSAAAAPRRRPSGLRRPGPPAAQLTPRGTGPPVPRLSPSLPASPAPASAGCAGRTAYPCRRRDVVPRLGPRRFQRLHQNRRHRTGRQLEPVRLRFRHTADDEVTHIPPPAPTPASRSSVRNAGWHWPGCAT